MADFNQLLNHPEKQVLIAKLASGESPKDVSAYLRNKYNKPDENHLRIPSTLFKEFMDKYGDHYGFVKQLAKKNIDDKLDKQISKSLLNTKEWAERLAEVTDEEIDFKKKWKQLILVLEARLEQVFDKVQENPGSTKSDYVMGKYVELWMQALEKADKLLNDRPDMRIEHSYTIQMVEQQAVVFQEAIRNVLARLDPGLSNLFIDMLHEEMGKMNSGSDIPAVRNIQRESKSVDKLLNKADEIGELVEEDEDE